MKPEYLRYTINQVKQMQMNWDPFPHFHLTVRKLYPKFPMVAQRANAAASQWYVIIMTSSGFVVPVERCWGGSFHWRVTVMDTAVGKFSRLRGWRCSRFSISKLESCTPIPDGLQGV